MKLASLTPALGLAVWLVAMSATSHHAAQGGASAPAPNDGATITLSKPIPTHETWLSCDRQWGLPDFNGTFADPKYMAYLKRFYTARDQACGIDPDLTAH